ncbi:PhzF family phenazine biosynthesis isomerase [Streptomyces sp. SCUT-3]|uniref:PhzF family phenazine biosynthesis protein n=1 Tax=Streptomyces TaxID=1883 RepID=UPI000CC84FD4|nr:MULTISPECIES: PhzF family phenazine biosynthesis isomerase [unclassified Streptomyces]MCZ2527364.1 PhzF family phenazine biosynthesis isomerase [Streptomyces sp. HB2AG]PLW66617.1 oxidoreductase [Streptomyces sp. DJ]QMV20757.1 PhzF family phenazine biosynthesis isomerase [Streptomyces sp. SCUT-3]
MRIRIVDAFTDRPFAGNPAGVVLLEEDRFPDDAWLQRVAAEVNLSETAFAHRVPQDPEADWALRWLTPSTEVDLCGHATLATAHVLHTTGAATGTVRFTTRGGILTATAEPDGTIALDFPAAPLTAVDVPGDLADALGAEPLSAHDTGPVVGDLLVELADERTVRGLDPDLAAVARLSHRGVIVTARAGEPGCGYDFVSRFFGPAVGVPEDPVTGSAHTALAPFWAARTGRTEAVGLQASARTGLVSTALRGDRVHLRGTAVTVVDGELLARP